MNSELRLEAGPGITPHEAHVERNHVHKVSVLLALGRA